MRTNQRVYFHSADEVTMFSQGVILTKVILGGDHSADDETLLTETWVSYEHGMIRTPNGWKVNRILSDYFAVRSTSLPER